MNNYDIYHLWLKRGAEEKELFDELESIKGDPDAIEDRFYRDLEFGTGGLRGVIGAGTNRMNVFTVAKATQGYSDYLKTHFVNPSVAIAYDSRIHSEDFARTAAGVFAANGIKVYIYPQLMPTPALSFAVRYLKCSGGIVITASHNPAKYNGYKVYGADGCQITTMAASEIQQKINVVDIFDGINKKEFEACLADKTVVYIDDLVTERYLDAVAGTSLLPEGMVEKDVAIVYTPLNGAGISCVPRSLKKIGFNNITLVDEQKDPDGNFPTCPYPNPEIRDALEVGLEWAARKKSDMLLATDPDCDRVGVAVKNGEAYRLISGNEMGVLLFDFVCKMRTANGSMPAAPVAVKTIVTTPMAQKIADCYGVELRNVLTGFKFIGEQIGMLEANNEENRYIFGFEESYGYLSGSFVRDKDAVNASLLISEMFAWYKAHGRTLVEVLNELYEKYGYYNTKLLTYTFEGSRGLETMKRKMQSLRSRPLQTISGLRIKKTVDYLNDEYTGLPASDVMHFFLENGGEAVIRPSGTEPKLKIYLTSVSDNRIESEELLKRMEEYFVNFSDTNGI